VRLFALGGPAYLLKFLLYSIGACDTSSTTLSYLCWELSRRSDVARKLQAELDTNMSDCKTLPDISILQGLPYLTAFIKEGWVPSTTIACLVTDYLKVFVFTVLLRAYLSVLYQTPT
jgi:cytochrome P450